MLSFFAMPLPVLFFILIFVSFVSLRIFLRVTLGRCKCATYLGGKTALITGGNSGIGYQTALALAARGCRVIIADKDNCDKAKEEIIEKTGNSNIVTKQFNLLDLTSIRALAKDVNETEEKLDILINNAGVGFQMDNESEFLMQINHFGPFLLTHLLIGLLKKSAPSKVIFVSSVSAFFTNLSIENLTKFRLTNPTVWSAFMHYGNTKLCNAITSKVLADKLQGTGVTANSLNPGLACTQFFEKSLIFHAYLPKYLIDAVIKFFAKTAEEGAQTSIHLALSKETTKISGAFFSDCRVVSQPSKVEDIEFSKQIWAASETYVNLSLEEKL